MIISITTDFGTRDGYVGTMMGVMAGIAPGVPFADITQQIPPQDVRSAAYVLWTAIPYFPPESVHLVVVDPGVGTVRRPIAAQTPWGAVVGPDNGVFSFLWEAAPPSLIVELANPAYQRPAISNTFHGRDIFSPAAAYIAAGVPLADFGSVVTDPVRLPTPAMEFRDDTISADVLYIDHFGNAITGIGILTWEGALLRLAPVFGDDAPLTINPARTNVRVNGIDLGPIRRTYGEVATGARLALIGSEGMLELAVNQGSGAASMGLAVGDRVEVVLS